MDRQVISSSRLAKELIQHGFKIIDIAPNRNDSKRTVFIFESSEEFKNYINSREEVNRSAKTNQNIKQDNKEKFSRIYNSE